MKLKIILFLGVLTVIKGKKLCNPCPPMWSPVCGFDGMNFRIFSNQCELDVAVRCRQEGFREVSFEYCQKTGYSKNGPPIPYPKEPKWPNTGYGWTPSYPNPPTDPYWRIQKKPVQGIPNWGKQPPTVWPPLSKGNPIWPQPPKGYTNWPQPPIIDYPTWPQPPKGNWPPPPKGNWPSPPIDWPQPPKGIPTPPPNWFRAPTPKWYPTPPPKWYPTSDYGSTWKSYPTFQKAPSPPLTPKDPTPPGKKY